MPVQRYPRNHVSYARTLKPLEWLGHAYGLFGFRAFTTKRDLLQAFDKAAPLDLILGTRIELDRIREVVETFGDGIDQNPHVSAIGRFLIKKISVNLLRRRKQVLQYYHSNRKFIEATGKVRAPLIITGYPRSGTTLLQRLLSTDPSSRSPFTFEMEIPSPPLTQEADPLQDPRIASSEAAVGTMARLARGFLEKFAESHLWSATEMEESLIYMLAHNGVSTMYAAVAGKAYIERTLAIEEKRPIFRYERLFFTMLDAYRPAPSHWTLKAPNYARYFPLIFAEYPDARVVLTHRNPLITLPSACRLAESWCIATDEDGSFDKHRFAGLVKLFLDACLFIPLEYRRTHPEKEDQIFDCVYEDLFSDPIAVARNIYDKFGLEYTMEFENNMNVYLKNNRQGKYGRHSYSLEEYGLDGESLYREYHEYMERYGYRVPETVNRPAGFDFSLPPV